MFAWSATFAQCFSEGMNECQRNTDWRIVSAQQHSSLRATVYKHSPAPSGIYYFIIHSKERNETRNEGTRRAAHACVCISDSLFDYKNKITMKRPIQHPACFAFDVHVKTQVLCCVLLLNINMGTFVAFNVVIYRLMSGWIS